MSGSPASLRIFLSREYAERGCVGSSGFSGCGKIHSPAAVFFRSRSTRSVLGGSKMERLNDRALGGILRDETLR